MSGCGLLPVPSCGPTASPLLGHPARPPRRLVSSSAAEDDGYHLPAPPRAGGSSSTLRHTLASVQVPRASACARHTVGVQY